MELPSPTLQAALGRLEVGSAAQLRAAAKQIRPLVRDLPVYDSVWIDGFLRAGLVTAFQADWLHAGRGEHLRIGEHILRSPLGRGSDSTTYLAAAAGCPRPRPNLYVLKIVAADRRPGTAERLKRLVTERKVPASNLLTLPEEVETFENRLLVRLPYIAGESAGDRLVRQGRFPTSAVLQIARRLLTALAEAAELGLPHGDIRLENIILTAAGDAQLVGWGIRPAVHPILSIQQDRPPEWYDGTAPERIGSQAPSTLAADAYALGCALWQLLAGRPAFPAGDALSKLAAHASKPVPAISDYAPDLSPELERLIARLTTADLEQRPTDFAGLARDLRSGSGRVVLARGHGQPAAPRGMSKLTPVITTAAILGIGLFLFETPETVLNATAKTIGAETVESGVRTAAAESETSLKTEQRSPLPQPNASGVVELNSATYEAAEITQRGPLVIRGVAESPAIIRISDRSLRLSADTVTLENVTLKYDPPHAPSARPTALALCECQTLHVQNCDFDGRPAGHAAGIAWRLRDQADPTAGRLELRQVGFRNVGQALFCSSAPRRVQFQNCLIVSVASAATFRQLDSTPVAVTLDHVTLREVQAVTAIGRTVAGASVNITATDSILALLRGASLFAVQAEAKTVRLSWSGAGTVTDTDSLVPVTGIVAPGADRSGTAVEILPTAAIEGIARAEIRFAGPASGPTAASRAVVQSGPRTPGSVVGVDLSRLNSARR